MMERAGLLAEIVPELEWTSHLQACLQLLAAPVAADFAVGVLLHELKPDVVQSIAERLKFSRAEMHHIVALVADLPVFSEVRQMSVSRLKRFFRHHRFEDYLELARIHTTTGGGDPANYRFARQKYEQWSQEDIAPRPFVTGQDLILLGFQPGPLFRDILTRVEDGQLEGEFTSKEEALAFIRRTFRENAS
jgi:poly(A) polymerase